MTKTIAIFGAGSGLGTSVARRFGAQGYRVALVARRDEPLKRLADALAAEGIEAAPFPADLADEDAAVAVLDAIRERLGRIDVLYYAPVSIETGFIPARELRAGALRDLLQLYVLTPVELVHAVLPEMLERGDGAILVGHGHTAIAPRAHMSGVGPAMAAMRNYLYSLHDELAGSGIYVGTLAITAMIARSAAHSALTSGTIDLPPDLPVVDPGDLADRLWELATERDEVELAGSGIYVGTLAITAMIARSAAHSALTSGTIDLPPDLPVVDPDELADRLWELATERDELELVHPPITATAK